MKFFRRNKIKWKERIRKQREFLTALFKGGTLKIA